MTLDLFLDSKSLFFNKHLDPIRKQAGLFFFETLAFSLGKSIEIHLKVIIPQVLAAFADPKEPVRLAAQEAMKVIMKNLSGHAVKKLMPIFLDQIGTDQWRTKLGAVEALGSMAYCAPKQLAIYLPEIVKIIRNVLSDTHPKVHDAGIQALTDIGSVIKNPEVAELSPQLINALSDPGNHLN